VFAMMGCVGARGVMKNTDQFRHAIERVAPNTYYEHGYYGRWLGGLETLLLEAGALPVTALDARVGELARQLGASDADIAELVADHNVASRPRTNLSAEQSSPLANSRNPGSSVRYVAAPPKFVIGDQVRTVALAQTMGGSAGDSGSGADLPHTRLPEYALGAVGEVVAWHRGWVLPDTNAQGAGEQPCHLYTVRFSAQALYGDSAESEVLVHLDLFEPYLSADY